jgi:hypothetical protein
VPVRDSVLPVTIHTIKSFVPFEGVCHPKIRRSYNMYRSIALLCFKANTSQNVPKWQAYGIYQTYDQILSRAGMYHVHFSTAPCFCTIFCIKISVGDIFPYNKKVHK